MANERVLWDAEFNERVVIYWLLGGAIAMTVTVVGILFLPVWFLAGGFICRRYLRSYRCTLTNRSLHVKKGWLIRVEKTVPLDRITDLGLTQGPIMRLFDLEALTVETAGQSSEGALISLTGIKQGRRFRDAVLQQRDLVVGSAESRSEPSPAEAPPARTGGDTELLADIRDTLHRIERKLESPS